MFVRIFVLLGFIILVACEMQDKKLPIIGERLGTKLNPQTNQTDTIYNTIPDFSLTNQDSQQVTPADFEDKIYVADFFFVSCPDICPIMTKQMLRIYEKFKDNPNIKIISHTINPAHDTVAVLKRYATDLQIDTKKWIFVTGKAKDIFEVALKGYFVAIGEGKSPGEILHGGSFVLVDKQKRVRGMYEGTDEKAVDRLINDIPILLKEYAK